MRCLYFRSQSFLHYSHLINKFPTLFHNHLNLFGLNQKLLNDLMRCNFLKPRFHKQRRECKAVSDLILHTVKIASMLPHWFAHPDKK